MTYKITEEQRKLLTEEVLGECFHELHHNENQWECGDSTCCKCKEKFYFPKRISTSNYTFTTVDDMIAVFRAIRDKEKWLSFEAFSIVYWRNGKYNCNWTEWLFLDNPERACVLAAEFWKENTK